MSAAADTIEASAQRERELRKIVLAWLNRKGYTRAEEQFKIEAEIAGARSPPAPRRCIGVPIGPARGQSCSSASCLALCVSVKRYGCPCPSCGAVREL